ncbi:hypothetical protein [Acidovorax sp. LjRoot194]|uniref:hypothetical protein n=1 Tax=Acidovorax sp. LjRoot194 TaxID=3342280 RepID=UPI003ECE9708
MFEKGVKNYMGLGVVPGPLGVHAHDFQHEEFRFSGARGFLSSNRSEFPVDEKEINAQSPSVQRYESAKQRLELEGYQTGNMIMPGYHVYTVNTDICTIGSKGCTEQEVFDQLRRFPAPQRFGTPDRTVGVKTGDRSFALAVGYVVHWVGRRMLTNTTIENMHLLNPGVVIREVVTVGDKIVIRTSGYGTGILPQINSGDAAEVIWSYRTDSKIIAAIRKKADESK